MFRTLWLFCFLPGPLAGTGASQCPDFLSVAPPALEVRMLGFAAEGGPCGRPLNMTAPGGLGAYPWDPRLPSVLIVHGRRPPQVRPQWVGQLARELLSTQRLNVLAVDWLSPRGRGLVPTARQAGRKLACLIRALLARGSSAETIHLIGFGVGAHIAGNAGAALRGCLGRITGLDPFGPEFTEAGPSVGLDWSDAQFVDVIHANFRPNEPVAALGSARPLGHVDFYIGKGHQLPGCPPGLLDRERYVLCSHWRAHQIFTSSIRSHCPLFAFPCLSRHGFERGQCTHCHTAGLHACPQLGYNTSWVAAERPVPFQQLTALLDVTSAPPFCVTPFLLEFQVGGVTPLRAYLFIQLRGGGVETSSLLLSGSAPVRFQPGKVYRFMVSANRDGDFSHLLLEFYTRRNLYLEWRKRIVHLSQLLLTRLPRDRGVSYFAYDVRAAEGHTVEVRLTKEVATEEEEEEEEEQ
uniref:Phospholipase A1 member A n=1 Tax=Lepisosteus oculatus TaxID=7918 RepID=W5LYS1_LEPOC|nr:PREDICTED: lipase member H-like [Lepisosteus oculatus]